MKTVLVSLVSILCLASVALAEGGSGRGGSYGGGYGGGGSPVGNGGVEGHGGDLVQILCYRLDSKMKCETVEFGDGLTIERTEKGLLVKPEAKPESLKLDERSFRGIEGG